MAKLLGLLTVFLAFGGLELAAAKAPYNYTEGLQKSIVFYEVQRSGILYKNRVPFRTDSALDDMGDFGEDLTGGWYDAGDHVKFGFPMAASVVAIEWGMYEYKDVYVQAGLWDQALDQIRWPLEYFLKCHVGPDELYYQVGDPPVDHAYWGRPEEMTMARPSLKLDPLTPGSEVAAETATAMTIGSLLFEQEDPGFSVSLLEHAIELYNFSDTFRGNYPDSGYYSPSEYGDELAQANLWLYVATGDQSYLDRAEQYYIDFNLKRRAYAYSWGDKTPAVQIMLYILTGKNTYMDRFQRYVNEWLPGGRLAHTPLGLVFRSEWGPLRYAANTVMLALIGADHGTRPDVYREFAANQTGYMLGDTGRSYVVGFGEVPPERPHHRSSSCDDYPSPCGWSDHTKPDPNPQTLYGALVGGPDINDYYEDNRQDYRSNEVACDYNAGFQTAMAAMLKLEMDGYWEQEPAPVL